MRQTDFDIIIVGAGPAGLSSAIAASDGIRKVAVLEKSTEVGYPVHTSGASWIDELDKLHVPNDLYNPVRRGVFMSPNSKAVFQYKTPVSCILDIRRFYQYLAKKASLRGAEIVVDCEAVEPIVETTYVRGVKARIGGCLHSLRAKVVIDASGFWSFMPKKLGWFKGFVRFGKGAEYDLVAPDWDEHEVHLLFGSRFAPHGYAWIFPHGDSRVRVGVGMIHPLAKGNPRRCLDELIFSPKLAEKRLKRVSCVEFHRGLIPSDGPLQKTADDGVIIVGDAAGQISAVVGEGIRFALDIGGMAGTTAAEAVEAGDCSYNFLSQYERRWRKKYERKFKTGLLINRRIAGYTDAKWDEKIRMLSTLKPDIIPYLLKGEFSEALLARLLVQNPLLIGRTTLKLIRHILRRGKNAEHQ